MSSGGITVNSGSKFKLILSGDGLMKIKEVLFTTSNSSYGESCYGTEGSYHTSEIFDKIEKDPDAGLVVVYIGKASSRCRCPKFVFSDAGLKQYGGQRTYYLCIATSEVIIFKFDNSKYNANSLYDRIVSWCTKDHVESLQYTWTAPSCPPG